MCLLSQTRLHQNTPLVTEYLPYDYPGHKGAYQDIRNENLYIIPENQSGAVEIIERQCVVLASTVEITAWIYVI